MNDQLEYESERKHHHQPRQVNPRAIVIVLGVAAVVSVALFFGYRYQVRQNAQALLEQAERAEKEGNLSRAADYLLQYLAMVPTDDDRLAHFASLSEKQAVSPRQKLRPFFMLEQVLRRKPDRDDLRLQAARLAVDLGLYKEARHHVGELQKSRPTDPDLMRLEARCEVGTGEFQKAFDRYREVTEQKPDDIESWETAIVLLRERLSGADSTDDLVRLMIEANPRNTRARVVAAQHFLRRGDRARAEEHIRFAQEQLNAKQADLAMLAAEVAVLSGRGEEARGQLERGLKEFPNDIDIRLNLARLEARAGNNKRATELLEPLEKKLPERPELLCELGSLLIDLGKTEEQLAPIQRQLKAPASAWASRLLQAQRLMREKKWGKARLILEQLRGRVPFLARDRQAALMLADCYLALGNPDQQIEAARHALSRDPTNPQAKLRLAAALAATGKIDQAILEYRALAEREPEALLPLARLLTAKLLAQPAAERDWTVIDKILERLPAKQNDTLATALFRAENALVRGQPNEARKLAEEARDKDPKQPGPWLLLIEMTRRQGSPIKALAIVAEAERRAGPRSEWYLTRVRLATILGGKDGLEELTRLDRQRQKLSGEERDLATMALATGFAQLADPASASKLWQELADRQPANLEVRLLLAERASRAGREEEVQKWARQVEEVEGVGGPFGEFLHALACLAQGASSRDKFDTARQHLARAGKLRPTWGRVPALEGEIDDREGRQDAAVRKYTAAIDLGESRIGILQRAVQLLYELRRYADADALMRRLPEQVRHSESFGRLSAALTLVGGDEGGDPKEQRRRALEVARKVVQGGTSNYRNLIFLGQMAWLAGEQKEAEQALRKARDMARDEPATWVALIQLLSRVDRTQAEKELAEAERTLPKAKAALGLANCHEVLGQPNEARKLYEGALKLEPTNAEVMTSVAAFLVRRGEGAEAEKLYRKVLTLPRASTETIRAARRALALQLAGRRGYRAYQEAEQLLATNLREKDSVEDQRVKALILATQPAQRREAIRLFESLAPLSSNTPSEMLYLLARLHEADGAIPKTLACLVPLLRGAPDNPVYLSYAALIHLRRKDTDEAGKCVDRLEKVAPQSGEAVELRARLLKETGKPEQAKSLVEKWVGGKPERLAPAALIMEAIGRDDDAEAFYRQLAFKTERPDGKLLLARHMARRKQLRAALQLCEESWGKARPEEVAGSCVHILRITGAGEKEQEHVANRITEALKSNPKSAALAVFLAELEDLRGRHDKAITYYRQSLSLQPNNIVAMNNLAYFLSVKEGKHAEALELITRVLDELGPIGEILDTRGLILLGAGKANEALRDFQAAIKQDPGPVKYFHLAQAQWAAGERRQAKTAFDQAKRGGLKEETIPVLERPGLKKLATELEE
jgi:tetratricopeptide (TPR) repeat protein